MGKLSHNPCTLLMLFIGSFFTMLGLLVPNRAQFEPLQPSLPMLGFVRRAWQALFRRH